MTKEQIESIESVALTIIGGAAVIYPPSAPIVSFIKTTLQYFLENGYGFGTPYELSAGQAAAIAAGMAAAKAGAVTSFKESHKDKLPSDAK